MSIETLRDDLKANVESLVAIAEPTPAELKAHLQHSLWPFLEALVGEMDDIDEAVAELAEGAAEVLHTETGALFAGLIAQGRELMVELKQRIGDNMPLLRKIKAWEALAKQGEEALTDIVVPDDEDEEAPDAAAPDGATP